MTLDSAGDVCLTCRSNSGERRISPGETIHEGRHWLVEHAYPVGLLGWVVIVLRRHAEALHDLSPDEFEELARTQRAVATALREETRCEKEYLLCLSEMPGFKHVHFHVVPRAPDLPPERKGGRVLNYMRPQEETPVDPESVAELCSRLRRLVGRHLGS